MSESSYQFLNEVLKSTEVTGSWDSIYPFTYEVTFSTKDSELLFIQEYKALTHRMIEQVQKRWEYDYQNIDVGLVNIQLKPEFSSNKKRDIN